MPVCAFQRTAFLVFILAGCTFLKPNPDASQEVILPITSIYQRTPHGTAPAEPAYLVIRQPVDWDTAKRQLPDEAIAAGLEAGIPSGQVILAAYAGVQPSSGCSVEIKNVKQQNDTIFVLVVFSAPGSNEIVLPSYTLPFHIVSVAVDSAESWDGHTIIFQDEQENILEQIVLP